ncbi:MAG: GNAT family N-acetyltransferase [Geminicoccaceae bacterium]
MGPPPAGLKVRAACARDVPSVCSLSNEPGYRWGTLRMPYQTEEATDRWLAAFTADDHLLVAELDGEVVGLGGLHRQPGRRSHVGVLGMGVRDAYRRRGVGTALLGALVALADDWLDLKRLELTVFVDNDTAIRLYERSGFVREAVLRAYAYRSGHFVDVISMARLRGIP